MKIAVIGAGISGLSIARILKSKGHLVDVYEKSSDLGGIAQTKKVDGGIYHLTGGHCFNSKYQEVLDFVFSFYERSKWNKISRVAKIFFKNNFISYPIEYSMKELYDLDPEFVINAVSDLISSVEIEPRNLKEWFYSRFGLTLSDSYFIPYNEKIWGKKADEMSYEWVKDKLPNPDKSDFIKSLFENKRDLMPHASFYYPKSGNQLDFIRKLAEGINIIYNKNINDIYKLANEHWIVNDVEYDSVISTVPLNVIDKLIRDFPVDKKCLLNKLKYNKVTTMFWRAKETSQTWTYFPEENTIFHRHIHIGNFCSPRTNHIITEAVGNISKNRMISEGRKFSHLLEPLDYHVSEHAYVLYDDNYSNIKKDIFNYIEGLPNFYTLGRFGEWEYYNMDICIKSALDLSKNFPFLINS